jgi:hypothetical protein
MNPWEEYAATPSQDAGPWQEYGDGLVDPFNAPEQASRGGNTVIRGAKDIARLFLSPATIGANAIGTAIGEGLAGGSAIEGAAKGAQSNEFLGFDTNMESDTGKWVEGKLSSAFNFLHDTFGEGAAAAFKDEDSRRFMKSVPALSPLAHIYESLDKDGKVRFESAAAGLGAAGPDIMLALLGGKGAKKVASKLEDTNVLDAAELARSYADEPLDVPSGTVQYEHPALEFAPDESFSPATKPQTGAELPQYEGGVDFDFGGLDTAKQDSIPLETLADEPQIDLPLIPRGKETDLRFKGNQYLRPDETEPPVAPDLEVDPRQQQLPFDEPASTVDVTKPLGQTGFGRGQRGSVGWIGKETPIEQLATKLNREEWGKRFADKNPEFANRPDVIDRVYETLNSGGAGKKPPSRNLVEAIEGNPILKGIDKGLGVVSTRIGNISQPVLHRAMKFEQGLLQNTHKKIGVVDTFLNEINKKVPKQARDVINNALIDNDPAVLSHVFNRIGRPDLMKEYTKVRSLLEETGKELQDTNSLEGLRENYFPRIVKDLKGLKEAMGSTHKAAIERRLEEAKQKAGGALSEVEQSKIVNSYLRGTMKGQFRPGFTKERKFDTVPEHLKQFYATPSEALHTYLRNAVQETETAKFFGRDAVKNPDTGKIDVDKSIGGLVAQELRDGRINGEQVAELESLLRSRFGPANKSSNLAVQTAKDAANIGLLGNVLSTITQGGDVIAATYLNGLVPTLAAGAQMALGKTKLNMKDFGLVDNISAEFVNSRKSGQAVNWLFHKTGFQQLDHIGKNLILNGAVKQAERMVKTKAGMKEFSDQWKDRFGEEFPQLVEDLKSGKKTPLTETFAFSKLAKIQPITKLELPQMYLDNPNGRLIYMLKSFAIKQGDLLRNDAWNEIKKGNFNKGMGNLMRYAMVLGMAGATTGYIKDWIMGRDIDPELSDVPLNVLKTFGFSEITKDKIKQGRVGEVAGDIILPPYKMFDVVAKDAIKEFDGNPMTKASGKSLNYVPWIGRILYERNYGGADEYNRRQFREQVLGDD